MIIKRKCVTKRSNTKSNDAFRSWIFQPYKIEGDLFPFIFILI
nr:MAG TPA: hypothetical protein [Caudoviricetes sp.]